MPISLSKSTRSALAGVIALAICGILLAIDFSPRPIAGSRVDAAQPSRLASDGKLRWYRGNLHTHSMWSDGDDYLEMVGLWYKDHGYDFLCFTDHNRLATLAALGQSRPERKSAGCPRKTQGPLPERLGRRAHDRRHHEIRLKTFEEVRNRIAEPGHFLLIQGEEISDLFGRSPIHINASNVQEAIPPMRGKSVADTIQNNFDAVIAQRERTGKPILVHLNHPNYYYGVTAEDLMRIRGDNFFEVYNGHPSVHNSGDSLHASTERIWDIILANRLGDLNLPVMYGLATDDGHRYHHIPSRGSEPGRGWVMVLAPELTPEALLASLEAGRFYATSGVKLTEVVSSPEGLDIAVDPEPGVRLHDRLHWHALELQPRQRANAGCLRERNPRDAALQRRHRRHPQNRPRRQSQLSVRTRRALRPGPRHLDEASSESLRARRLRAGLGAAGAAQPR